MNPPLRYQFTHDDIAFCDSIEAAGFHAIKYHTLQVVEDLLDEGVEGDFAECGVLYGAHPAIMLRSLRRRGITNRTVHLFDSFQGIPRASAADDAPQRAAYGLQQEGQLESSGVSVSSLDNTLENLRRWCVYHPKFIEVHAGWFQDTLPTVKSLKLALLRVDVDLYESTRIVYKHLYDSVVPGGYIIDDDYGSMDDFPACRGALIETIGSKIVQHVDGQDTTVWWQK